MHWGNPCKFVLCVRGPLLACVTLGPYLILDGLPCIHPWIKRARPPWNQPWNKRARLEDQWENLWINRALATNQSARPAPVLPVLCFAVEPTLKKEGTAAAKLTLKQGGAARRPVRKPWRKRALARGQPAGLSGAGLTGIKKAEPMRMGIQHTASEKWRMGRTS